MKNRNLHINNIKQTPSVFLNRPGCLEFNIIKRHNAHYFELTDEHGNIFLTGIVGGTVNENLHQIHELKKAVRKPNRFQKEQLEHEESIYFVIKNAMGYPIASSFLFFSHRDCRNAISVLRLLIPFARVNAVVMGANATC